MMRGLQRQITGRRATGIGAVLGACACLLLPSSAAAQDHIVYVADDANLASVAASVGATPEQTFTDVAYGFVADLSPAQIRQLQRDARVVDLHADAPFSLNPFKRAPFKRAPFKRAPFKRNPLDGDPFKRNPFKRNPFKRNDIDSPWRSQVESTSTMRIGADALNLPPVDADIAVLDSGVDVGHPDLNVAAALSCVPGENGRDRDGHGTMVAGLAAAEDNNIGIKGVAPGARIWSMKVANARGVIMESAALCALDWVARNADTLEVANMSWSGEGTPTGNGCNTVVPPAPQRTKNWRHKGKRGFPWRSGGRSNDTVDTAAIDALEALVCKVEDAGVTLVAAAGNEARDAATALPAAWPQVLAVSSFADTDGAPGGLGEEGCLVDDADDTFSSFSNFGAVVDIAAPGECLTTTDVHGDYSVGSGTSFASGVASGAAALAAASLGHDPSAVRAHLLATAEPGPIPGDPDSSPEGILHVQ